MDVVAIKIGCRRAFCALINSNIWWFSRTNSRVDTFEVFELLDKNSSGSVLCQIVYYLDRVMLSPSLTETFDNGLFFLVKDDLRLRVGNGRGR